MASPLATDYLALEPLLIERLRAQTSLRHVLPAPDLAAVEEAEQFTPAVHVLWWGERVPQGRDARVGIEQIVGHTWLAVVAVRNAKDMRTGAGVRGEAGGLLAEVNAALQGWRPGPGWDALAKVSAPRPLYRGAFAYFPLAFEAVTYTRGSA